MSVDVNLISDTVMCYFLSGDALLGFRRNVRREVVWLYCRVALCVCFTTVVFNDTATSHRRLFSLSHQ